DYNCMIWHNNGWLF
nr:immunoglobulin light chain junction region [Macaca mulatta]